MLLLMYLNRLTGGGTYMTKYTWAEMRNKGQANFQNSTGHNSFIYSAVNEWSRQYALHFQVYCGMVQIGAYYFG